MQPSFVSRWISILVLVGCFPTASVLADETGDKAEPVTPSYYHDIRPIFQAHCQGCHQPAKPLGEYVMTGFDLLLQGGESAEAAIVPGKPAESYLISQITPDGEGEAEMPKGRKALAAIEIEQIKAWIAAGAADDTPEDAGVRYSAENPPTYESLPIVTSLDFSPDGKLLAVAGFHEILLHKSDGSQLVARLVGLSERIESVAFSPNGKWLAATGGLPGRLGEVQIWDVEKQQLKLSVPVTFDSVFGASWSPDSKSVAFGCTDNSVRAIDASDGEQILLQRAPNDWTLDTVFSVDGSHLISTGRDMAVKLTHFKTQRFIDNVTSITPGALKGGLFALDRHPQRDEVLVGGDDGVPKTFRIHRVTNRVIGDDSNFLRKFPAMDGRIFDVAYAADGKRLAAASSYNGKGQVFVYSFDYEIEHPEDIKKIVSKTGRNAEERKKLEEYRTSGVDLVAKMEGQSGSVYALSYKPDGQVIASAGYDGQVRLNDPSTGKLISEFTPVPLTKKETVAQK